MLRYLVVSVLVIIPMWYYNRLNKINKKDQKNNDTWAKYNWLIDDIAFHSNWKSFGVEHMRLLDSEARKLSDELPDSIYTHDDRIDEIESNGIDTSWWRIGLDSNSV